MNQGGSTENTGYTLGDIAAVTENRGCNDMGFGGNGFVWVLLFAMIFGNNGFGFGGKGGAPVTEADLCNANNFNQLQNDVGRLSDQLNNSYMGLQNGLSNLGYESLRNSFGLSQQIGNRFAEQAQAQSECCCTTQRGLDGVNYNIATNAAAINANTDAKIQKVLDMMCENKIESLQGKVSELQNQLNLCGVVRYPQYVTTANPFFGGGYGYGNACNI